MSEQEHARPATYAEIFASGEYRAVFSASALSWTGDFIAKAAVTAMVYRQTGSVPLSAAAFAVSYLPWLIGGPVLAAVAERYPNRTVMVTSDLIRAGLIALVALPGMPVAAVLVLLLLTALLNPPFEAARSALLPRILSGERYVGAVALQNTANQAALIVGYMVGGTLAAFDAHLALLIDAATFAFSAFLIGLAVHARGPALAAAQRTYLLRETADGFRLVFGNRVLRAIAVLVFGSALIAPVPEGLAAAWAGHLTSDVHQQGWMQGLIMIGNATGLAVGGVLFSRLVTPDLRRRLIRVFALLVPLALTPAVINPPVGVVSGLGFVCGVAVAAFFPAVNGLFVQVLPDGFRARAFGIMQSGTMILQGLVILVTGELARLGGVPVVVGLWSIGGVVVMAVAVAAWPSGQRIDAAIDAANTANTLAAMALVDIDGAAALTRDARGGDARGGTTPGGDARGGTTPGGDARGGTTQGGATQAIPRSRTAASTAPAATGAPPVG